MSCGSLRTFHYYIFYISKQCLCLYYPSQPLLYYTFARTPYSVFSCYTVSVNYSKPSFLIMYTRHFNRAFQIRNTIYLFLLLLYLNLDSSHATPMLFLASFCRTIFFFFEVFTSFGDDITQHSLLYRRFDITWYLNSLCF